MKQILQSFKTGELWLAEVPAPSIQSAGIVVQTHHARDRFRVVVQRMLSHRLHVEHEWTRQRDRVIAHVDHFVQIILFLCLGECDGLVGIRI